MKQRKHARGRLGRGALTAVLLHAQLLGPLLVMTFIYAARDEAQRAEEVDVAFKDVSPDELPADLPSLDDLTQPPPLMVDRPPPEKKRERDKLKMPAPPPKKQPIAKQPPPKPEPEVPLPPMPPMPKEAPPPPPERKSHEKMVELEEKKDKKDDEKPLPDAKFLANRNSRAEVETRAKDTNLEKAQSGTEGSEAPSQRQDDQIGEDKAKIAELRDVKSAEGRKAPDVTPHTNPQLSEPDPRPAPDKSLLALRDPAPRRHELTPETVDPSLPRTRDGDVVMPENKQMRGTPKDSSALNKGQRMKLALTAKDYEYLFGADAAAERRLAQTEHSHKQGKFQKALGRVKSALENFIPEVQPGNQTALNARAAPFAAYIARMHRSIHKLWGFGALEDWDEKPGSSPFNNPDLLTTLELVLNANGTIDKVTVVRTSGYLPYDAAAIDVAYSAGPYPDPPNSIRSANGKIYIHWRFYRDARACATAGVDYFILNNPPAGSDKPSASGDGGPTGSPGAAPESPGHAAEGEGLPEEPPRRLERGLPTARKRAAAAEATAAAEAGGTAPTGTRAGATSAAAPPRADDPGARQLAEAWFAAFAGGDASALLSTAAYPFRSGDGVAASTPAQLQGMLTALLDETPERKLGNVQVFTRASLRGVMGKLPKGVDDDPGLLFAVGQVSASDAFVLILVQKAGVWKTVGLVRR